jgi:polyphosphate glucokinase
LNILGVDIGGSGIKGAVVETETGELKSERVRIPTPQPATPEAVANTVLALQQQFQWQGPVGCTFPAIIKSGTAMTAANVDKSWIGCNVESLLSTKLQMPVSVLNDADAAGVAEISLGAGRMAYLAAGDWPRVIILVTLGTGIGSALFLDGKLLPNTEFGHLRMSRVIAEHYASDAVRETLGLSWQVWGGRLNSYLQMLELFFSPDLLIIGGGVSKKSDKFFRYLHTQAKITPAYFRNRAGIVGAALYALAAQQPPANQTPAVPAL